MKIFVRILFSWPVSLLLAAFLVLFWGWYLVYLPTIGESRRIEKIAAEFKAHGCRSMCLETVLAFEKNWFLAPLKLERKILVQLDFESGAMVPQEFLKRSLQLPDLRVVFFLNSNPSDDEFTWVVTQPNIKFVEVSGKHQIGKSGFHSVPKNKIGLSLRNDESIEDDLRHLALGKSLSALSLHECRLNEHCFDSLSALLLIDLSLNECDGFSVDGFQKLKHLPLVNLIIRNNDSGPPGELTDDMLREIVGMSELSMLVIGSQPNLTDNGYDALKKLPKLERLYIIPVSPKQAEIEEHIRKRPTAIP